MKIKGKNKSTILNLEQLHLDESENTKNLRNNKSLYDGSVASNKKIHLRNFLWRDKVEIYDMKTILKTSFEASSFNTNILKY